MRTRRRVTLVLALACFASAGVDTPARSDTATSAGGTTGPRSAAAAPHYKKLVRKIAPGLKLIRLIDRVGPKRIWVLRVDPRERVTIDVGAAARSLGGLETTKSIARRRGAIAAINGDFAVQNPVMPMHTFAEDGVLIRASRYHGANFGVAHNERRVFLDTPSERISAHVKRMDKSFPISRWNDGEPNGHRVAAYTPNLYERAARRACTARLRPLGPPSRAGNGRVQRAYKVRDVGCSKFARRLQGSLAISAERRSGRAKLLQRLRPGNRVSVSWTVGFPGVIDSIGGIPRLVADRKIVVSNCRAYICLRHPRTGVGITAEGHVLMVVVDGRQRGYSNGMTITEFARLFRRLGATDAVNLDGGGSSTMIVRGAVQNRPSFPGGERTVSSALLVLPGADRGEARLGPAVAAQLRAGKPVARAAAASALSDPGSSAGLLDALAGGLFGADPASVPSRALAGARRAHAGAAG